MKGRYTVDAYLFTQFESTVGCEKDNVGWGHWVGRGEDDAKVVDA